MTMFSRYRALAPASISGTRTESGTVTDSTARTCSGSIVLQPTLAIKRSPTPTPIDAGASALDIPAATCVKGGVIAIDPNGGNVTATFEGADDFVSAGMDTIYDLIEFEVYNASDGAETLTLATPASITEENPTGNLVLDAGEYASVKLWMTNVTASSEAARCFISNSSAA